MALATTGPAAVPQAVSTAEGDQRPVLATGPIAAAAAPRGIEARVVVGSVLAILLGLIVGAVLNEAANPPALTVPAGISVFALFYVITQGWSACWNLLRPSWTRPAGITPRCAMRPWPRR